MLMRMQVSLVSYLHLPYHARERNLLRYLLMLLLMLMRQQQQQRLCAEPMLARTLPSHSSLLSMR